MRCAAFSLCAAPRPRGIGTNKKAAGQKPATALAIAAMTVALVYSDEFDEAMAEAMKVVSNKK